MATKVETAALADALNIVLGERAGTFCPGDVIGAEDIDAARDKAADFIRKYRREIPADLAAFEFNKAQCSSRAYVRGWQISIDEAREHIAAARLIAEVFGSPQRG